MVFKELEGIQPPHNKYITVNSVPTLHLSILTADGGVKS